MCKCPASPRPRSEPLSSSAPPQMLAAARPVTLRSVVAGTGASTMAVYTHFGDMDGLWRAVRQEGFGLLAERLRAVPAPRTRSPMSRRSAPAYAAHALAYPELYRVMFDAAADLDDPEAADTTLQLLVDAVARAREHGRLAAETDPAQCATQIWVSGHGPLQLVVTGVLPADASTRSPCRRRPPSSSPPVPTPLPRPPRSGPAGDLSDTGDRWVATVGRCPSPLTSSSPSTSGPPRPRWAPTRRPVRCSPRPSAAIRCTRPSPAGLSRTRSRSSAS